MTEDPARDSAGDAWFDQADTARIDPAGASGAPAGDAGDRGAAGGGVRGRVRRILAGRPGWLRWPPRRSGGADRSAGAAAADPVPGFGASSGPAEGAASSAARGPSMPGWLRVSRWSSTTRWAVFGGVALLVVATVGAVAVASGARWLGASADARAEASGRVGTACAALETRLNRLVPPGATNDPAERATAVRYEDVAVEPLLTELDRVTKLTGRYRQFRDGWQRLVDTREQFAKDLDGQVQTGRPAFFVLAPDADGRDLMSQITRSGPDTCDAAARRLAAPDL